MIGSDCQRKTLGELCHLFYGRRTTARSPRGGYVVWNGYREIGCANDYLLEKAEVAITCRGVGGTGNLYITRPKSSVTDNVIVAQPKDGQLDRHYLYWSLLASDLARLVTGSVQHQITIRRLASHAISVPPQKEQRMIASTLDAFDRKIELNQRTMETLKLTSESIFKSWFVDFEPVRTRTSGQRSDGIGAQVAALFPGSFEKSLKGDIPRGWKLMRLGNLTKFLGRGIIPTYIPEGGVSVINQRCVRGGQINFDLARHHDTAIRSVAERELQKGDVLVNSTGATTLGRVAQILHFPGPVVADSHITVVRPDPSKVSRCFFAFLVRARKEEMKRLAKGSTRQLELGKNSVGSLTVLVPPLSIQKIFDGLVSPMQELISALQLQNRSLAAVRDKVLGTLIPNGRAISERRIRFQ